MIYKKSKFQKNEINIDELYVGFNKNISSKWEVGKSYEIGKKILNFRH